MKVPPRILVSLPCYGGQIYDLYHSSWTKLLRWAHDTNVELTLQIISNESSIQRARNMGVMKALEHRSHFTHILFLDADMGYPPYQLERLLLASKDIAGAPGCTKHIHWDNAYKAILAGKDPEIFSLRYAVNFLNPDEIKCQNGFAKVKDFGFCFCLVRMSVINKLIEAYPSVKCEHMAWVNGKPVTDVDTQYALFDSYVEEDGRYLECDHAFLARWRAIGGEVWADMTARLDHCGLHHYRGDLGAFFFNQSYFGDTFKAIRTSPTEFQPFEEEESPEPQKAPQTPPQKFHIATIRPEGIRFPLCFQPMAKLLQAGLRDLGYEVTRRENHLVDDEDTVNIVFGWHMWPTGKKEKPPHPFLMLRNYRAILYQAEQIMPDGRELPDWYFASLKRAEGCWDYSSDHVEFMESQNLEPRHVPPAYHPSMETIDYDGTPKDIDVLFYGAMNPRRSFICHLLEQVCNTKVLVDVWGSELEDFIARSKLVLNVHYYPSQTLERLRISQLLANGVPVISEISENNPYGDGIKMVTYHDLLKTVMHYLRNDDERIALGLAGQEIFKQTLMVDVLRAALSDVSPSDAIPAGECIVAEGVELGCS